MQRLRLARGLSLTQLARAARIARRDMLDIEEGVVTPRRQVAEALAKALGVDVSTLFDDRL